MKRFALVTLLIAGLASPVMAGEIQVGYPGSPYGMYQTGNGGEFTFNPLGGWIDVSVYAPSTRDVGVAGTFQTFCIEAIEHIGPYPSTYNAGISQNAIYGGVGPAGDPVSVGTGWLYSQFVGGTLAGYSFGGTVPERQASAGALQNTIWWLEGEAADPGAGNIFRNAVLAEFVNAPGAMADGGWTYHVYALNLWTKTGARVQDGLVYYLPDGGATLMLLGGALFGLGVLRRKLRR